MLASRVWDHVQVFSEDLSNSEIFNLKSKKDCDLLKEKVGVAFDLIITNPDVMVDCNKVELMNI